MERELKCPAEQTGVSGCRFCIYLPGGGASELCITKLKQGEMRVADDLKLKNPQEHTKESNT